MSGRKSAIICREQNLGMLGLIIETAGDGDGGDDGRRGQQFVFAGMTDLSARQEIPLLEVS